MLNINVHYDGKQEAFLKKLKKKSGKTWPELILFLAGYEEQESR